MEPHHIGWLPMGQKSVAVIKVAVLYNKSIYTLAYRDGNV